MDFIESKGRTVDEAVFNGLVKMDLSIDEVNIEILDEGRSLFKSARVRLTKKPEDDLKAALAAQEEERERQRKIAEERRSERRDRHGSRDRRGSRPHDRRAEASRNSAPKNRRREDTGDFVYQEPQNDAEKFLIGLFSRMGVGARLKSESEEGLLKVDISGRGMGVLIGRRGETLDALQYLTSLVINNGKDTYTKVMLDTEHYRKKREDTLRRLAARLADKVVRSGKRVVLEPMNPYERRILHSTLQDYDKVYTYSEGEDPFRSVVVALRDDDEQGTKTGE